ncbi:MAG: hypothetical protein EOO30_11750 [Comamonadaceae bacterium]|nr:MAG: hypothetical protein EOO30_11750 [Comamonadaceae bacterium]
MPIAQYILIALIAGAFLVLHVKATIAVLRDDASDKGQKFGQLAFVWLVPLLGAVVVLAVHRAAEPPSRRYREAPDPGDDFAMSGRSVKNVTSTLDGE